MPSPTLKLDYTDLRMNAPALSFDVPTAVLALANLIATQQHPDRGVAMLTDRRDKPDSTPAATAPHKGQARARNKLAPFADHQSTDSIPLNFPEPRLRVPGFSRDQPTR